MKLIDIFEATQGRVIQGHSSQEQTIHFLKRLAKGKQFELISSSRPGSKLPDIVAKINDVPVQFEVKGRSSGIGGQISIFNLSATRGIRNKLLDTIASIFEDKNVSFEQAIDQHRKKNPLIGYPGDQGALTSGKVPPTWKTSDSSKIDKFKKIIINHLHSKGDNYLIIHDRNQEKHYIFWTGLGQNVLNAPPLPPIRYIVADTGGGANLKRQQQGVRSGNSLRFAIKINFDL